MHLPSLTLLGGIFGASELALSLWRRAGADTTSHDRHSLWLLWAVILAAIAGATTLSHALPEASWPAAPRVYAAGVAIFALGLMFRWYAILHLGRWFTVNVAIAKDQTLVQDGPYRHVRHPSYSGALIAFLGYGLCLGNAASLALLLGAVGAVFAWRIRVEERALAGAFGDRWTGYAQGTSRLIPGLY
jgi:protein-S-isoprenylcysteine O-methyltransferase